MAAGLVPEAWKWPWHAGGRFSGPGDHSGPISGHFRRFRATTDYLRLEHCDVGTVETSETSTLCVETRQMSVLATEEMSVVETGQMSSVETGQMSAVETGQMSAVETRQMSSAETRQM